MIELLNKAKEVLEIEAQAILDLKASIGDDFLKALNLILECQGKLIISGIGKSGIIARKMASTLCSTGTPAVFLHAAESSHGDLGVISKNDVVLAISYGGESDELKSLLQFVKRQGVILISITGNKVSRLGCAGDVTLEVRVSQEACPLGLAPTSSSTATLALCDALSMCALEAKGFKKEDFAEFHPGGQLGRRLLIRVKDIMTIDYLPLVQPQASMIQILSLMTQACVRGICGVVNENGDLIGVITDGDIRKKLNTDFGQGQWTQTLEMTTAEGLMSRNPKCLDQNELAEKALFLMEKFRIQCLFVQNNQSLNPQKPIGLIHLQDLLSAKIR